MIIRSAGTEGIPHVLALLDRATEWLVSQGRTGQWGTEPQSTDPRRIAQSRHWAENQGCTATESFSFELPRGLWLGQVLEQRV